MPAKNHVNRNQFIDVYHASDNPVPPHELDSEEHARRWAEEGYPESNPTGDAIYAGSADAAAQRAVYYERGSTYRHHYRIPRAMVRPEIFGDDMKKPDSPVRMYDGGDNPLTDPPQLFEMLPAQVDLVKPGNVLQYRNDVEDSGGISHIMHKQDIREGKIQYVGRRHIKNYDEWDEED